MAGHNNFRSGQRLGYDGVPVSDPDFSAAERQAARVVVQEIATQDNENRGTPIPSELSLEKQAHDLLMDDNRRASVVGMARAFLDKAVSAEITRLVKQDATDRAQAIATERDAIAATASKSTSSLTGTQTINADLNGEPVRRAMAKRPELFMDTMQRRTQLEEQALATVARRRPWLVGHLGSFATTPTATTRSAATVPAPAPVPLTPRAVTLGARVVHETRTSPSRVTVRFAHDNEQSDAAWLDAEIRRQAAPELAALLTPGNEDRNALLAIMRATPGIAGRQAVRTGLVRVATPLRIARGAA